MTLVDGKDMTRSEVVGKEFYLVPYCNVIIWVSFYDIITKNYLIQNSSFFSSLLADETAIRIMENSRINASASVDQIFMLLFMIHFFCVCT